MTVFLIFSFLVCHTYILTFSSFLPSMEKTLLSVSWLLFFSWINNEFYWWRESPKYTRCILGKRNNQALKEQESKNSKKVEKENNPVASIQSNKVQRNCSFKSMILRSHPSKLLALHTLHKHHIRQWGIAFQITEFWWQPNLPCQQANKSFTCPQHHPLHPKKRQHSIPQFRIQSHSYNL